MPEARYVLVHEVDNCFIDDDARRGYGSYAWADLLAAIRTVRASNRRTGKTSRLRVESAAVLGDSHQLEDSGT